MEEIEVPIEKVQEDMHERAEHAREAWFSQVALTSAILAVFAAICSLMAGHHSNEAMIEQIRSSDKWGYYQAKGIKASILSSKIDLIESSGRPVASGDREKLTEYKKEQEEISKEAREKEGDVERHLHSHQTLARAVTLFQVAIAIAAISILTKRRRFWFVGIGFGVLGVLSLVLGIL